MSLAVCTFSEPNQRTLRFSYVLKQPEQMREQKEEENVWGAEGGGAAAEPGALWSFSLSCWKVSHLTGCMPTAQRNAMHLFFWSATTKRYRSFIFQPNACKEDNFFCWIFFLMKVLTQVEGGRETIPQTWGEKSIFQVKYGFENENTPPSSRDEKKCFLCLLSCRGGPGSKAAADRSHMLPRCSALQRCQASLKEWSASPLCYPTIMCLTFPWQRCHSTSPPSFQLESPRTHTRPTNPLRIKPFAQNLWFKDEKSSAQEEQILSRRLIITFFIKIFWKHIILIFI